MQILEWAPAKINLYLKVFEKREDGYHRVETAMVKLLHGDEIRMEVEEGQGISIEVPEMPSLANETNLAVRAAQRYVKVAGLTKKIRIHIHKQIFIAGGLGGGSSDAGAVLRGLDQKFHGVDPQTLHSMAAELGADVPFFLSSCAFGIGSGKGDEVEFFSSMPSFPVLLVHPGVSVSTPDAYRSLARTLTWKGTNDNSFHRRSVPRKWSDLKELLSLGNDLQEVVEKRFPEIKKVRQELREAGAAFSQMSGSGGTVFGLFETEEEIKRANQQMSKRWKTVITVTQPEVPVG